MKVSISMSLFLIDLVAKRSIREARDRDIEKGEGLVRFKFRIDLDMGRNVINMGKEILEFKHSMRPNNKAIIHKILPNLWF